MLEYTYMYVCGIEIVLSGREVIDIGIMVAGRFCGIYASGV